MILPQVGGVATGLRNLLQLSLSTRSDTEVVQTADSSQHGGQCNLAGFLAEEAVWS
jgi:hypothetical protein